MMDLTKESVTALTSGGDKERIPLAWHPDGQKILFVTLSLVGPGPEWSDIFVMDNNGENIINLTQTPEMEVWASWSPDGEQIVFDREVGEDEGAIFIMEADGQNPQRPTFEPGRNYAPSWSPDGNKIAFLSYRNGATRIYTMDTNGQNVQQVTHHGHQFDGPPAWSPDGRWLAFVSVDDEGWGLYITGSTRSQRKPDCPLEPAPTICASLESSGLVTRWSTSHLRRRRAKFGGFNEDSD